MHADGQPAAFAARTGAEPRGKLLGLLDDPLRRLEELLSFDCRACPPVGPFKQCGTHLVFEIAQATTERRLSNVECFSSLPKAAVLGGHNGPTHLSQRDIHLSLSDRHVV